MQPLKSLSLIFLNKDLRRRILVTVALIIIFRLIAQIPLPHVDIAGLRMFFEQNQVFGLLDMFSGGAVGRFSLALLGVGPYITASIAFQLLTMLIPQLEVLQKEGEYGRRKINQYTRLASVPLAFIEGYGLIKLLVNQNVVRIENNWDMFMVLSIVTASSVLLMWLGEIISEKGIGNGVSMIIAIGIIAGLPQSIQSLVQVVAGNPTQIFMACIYGLIILAMIVVIIWVTLAERRIQVTYARRVASSRTASNVESYLPLKINAAGVIPIIFATSILVIPGFLAQLFADARSDWLRSVANTVSSLINNNYVYASLFFVLIVAFTFFYVSIIVKPQQIAENLQKQGSFVPGVRPGKETANYIHDILYRITSTGALFLALIAIVPYLLQATTPEFRTIALGGTGILIIVSVAIEIMNQIKSQMATQTYDKFI